MTITRSENMRRIQGKNTGPEMVVRGLLRTLGYPGYRLHRKDLPGKPDIAYIGRRKVIVINGCFWHGHDCKKGSRRPKSNQDYWLKKIDRNQTGSVRISVCEAVGLFSVTVRRPLTVLPVPAR